MCSASLVVLSLRGVLICSHSKSAAISVCFGNCQAMLSGGSRLVYTACSHHKRIDFLGPPLHPEMQRGGRTSSLGTEIVHGRRAEISRGVETYGSLPVTEDGIIVTKLLNSITCKSCSFLEHRCQIEYWCCIKTCCLPRYLGV